jgi:hypothetical protein
MIDLVEPAGADPDPSAKRKDVGRGGTQRDASHPPPQWASSGSSRIGPTQCFSWSRPGIG